MVSLAESFERTALSVMTNLALAAELSLERDDSLAPVLDDGDSAIRIGGISLADLERKPDEPLQ